MKDEIDHEAKKLSKESSSIWPPPIALTATQISVEKEGKTITGSEPLDAFVGLVIGIAPLLSLSFVILVPDVTQTLRLRGVAIIPKCDFHL